MQGALLFFRYGLYLLIFLPTILYALAILSEHIRFSSSKSAIILSVGMLVIVLALALIGTLFGIEGKWLFLIGLAPLYALFSFLTKEQLVKTLFAFFNATMITTNSLLYGFLLAAPMEADNADPVLLWPSSLCVLFVAVLLGLIYRKTLAVKIPYLLRGDKLEWNWRFAVLVPGLITLLFFWCLPHSVAVVMTGRIRVISLAFLVLAPLTFQMVYNVFWHIAINLGETARLRTENELMVMENKRYEELRSYMNETRALRHDFRQHMLALDEYAKKGEMEKLTEYIRQFSSSQADHKGSFAANAAVDAVASHYDQTAVAQQTKIDWLIGVPEKLPLPESDFIAIFGNLIENALHAVKELPEEKRRVHVTVRMLSDAILGVTVRNPYAGTIKIGRNGLPASMRKGHGVGLSSVKAAVHRYSGVLDISTEGGIFIANVLLYL